VPVHSGIERDGGIGAEDIAPVFAAIKAAQADALFVVGDPLTFVYRSRIHTLALTARLPTVHVIRESVAERHHRNQASVRRELGVARSARSGVADDNEVVTR
jgi:hypothetical protein